MIASMIAGMIAGTIAGTIASLLRGSRFAPTRPLAHSPTQRVTSDR